MAKRKSLKIFGKSQEPKEVSALPEKEEWTTDYEGQLAVDVYQTDSNVVVKAPVAGVKPEELDITVTDDMVTIRGERKEEKKIEKENYLCQECYWGAFSRSIILPVQVASEKAKAIFKDGILTITAPKAARARTKKVKVKKLS
jgi:HSP20 family protein